MNIYRLWYREIGCLGSLNDYNVLAVDMAAAFVVGNRHAEKDNPGMVMECCRADEIARDIIADVGILRNWTAKKPVRKKSTR